MSTPACPATINLTPTDSGGEQAIVTVLGPFVQGDIEQFRAAIANVSRGLVVFSSDGGNLVAGLEIGTMLRLKGLATLVPDGERCASACAIAWLGGTTRYMGATAQIGFHGAYVLKDGVTSETSSGNALVGAYFNRIGLPDRAIVYLTQAAPDSLAMLNIQDAAKLGIDVNLFSAVSSTPNTDLIEPKQAQQPEAAPSTLPEQPAGHRFFQTSCGSIADVNTGLEWYVGPDISTSWQDAIGWAGNLKSCGESWSAPTSADLGALFDKSVKAGLGYLTHGKRWPAHIDPAFSAIGEGSWVWTNREPSLGSAFAMNLNQGIEVKLPRAGFAGATRAFAISREGNAAVLVVRRFYKALAVGDGERAARLIVPEKRNGPFSPEAMSQFYSTLVEPLHLIAIASNSESQYLVRYSFRSAKRACDGQALVTTEERSSIEMISGIRALSEC
jgi:hypothetical protein